MKPGSVIATIGTLVYGRVRCQVVDSATGKIKRDYGWQNNLILNQGLNALASLCYWSTCSRFAAAGTGSLITGLTTPTTDDSGAATASQSGNIVTISDIIPDMSLSGGNWIRFDSGEQTRIVDATDPQHVVVSTSDDVAAVPFKVYRAAQIQLDNEIKRSNAYLPGAGNCGTIYDIPNNKITFRRTTDFNVEAAEVTYTEIGMSWADVYLVSGVTHKDNLFSRIVLDTPVTCEINDQLRVIYDLIMIISPTTQRAISPVISGWDPVDAVEIRESLAINTVATDGTSTSNFGEFLTMEPAGGIGGMISNATDALRTVLNPASDPYWLPGTQYAIATAVNIGAYVPLSFQKSFTCVWTPASGKVDPIKTFCAIYNSYGSLYRTFSVRFNSNHTKLDTYELDFTIIKSWGQILGGLPG